MAETPPTLGVDAQTGAPADLIGQTPPAESWLGVIGHAPAFLHLPDGMRDLLTAGGPIMYILLGMSVLATAIVFVKLWQFAELTFGGARQIEPALDDWRTGHRPEALERLAGATNPLAQVVATAMAGCLRDNDAAALREEIERRALGVMAGLRGHLRGLEVIATLSPLLGLLGTVIGMIDAFRALEASGNQVDPSVLSGGIWVALLTTAAGLAVAIPTTVALNGLERWVEGVTHRLEDQLTRVFTADLRLDTLQSAPLQPLRTSRVPDAS
jgi:biopolymer transport protein ExbB